MEFEETKMNYTVKRIVHFIFLFRLVDADHTRKRNVYLAKSSANCSFFQDIAHTVINLIFLAVSPLDDD